MRWILMCCLIPYWIVGQDRIGLEFDSEIFDFGYLEEKGGTVTHSFTFTNNGNRPVRILSVKASCGCTTPDWSQEAILPGKSGFIQAQFDPRGRPGYFNKSLTVTSDWSSTPIVLQIKGQVASNVENLEFTQKKGSWMLRSKSLNLGKIYLLDEFKAKEFAVLNGGDKPVKFLGKYEAAPYIKIEVEPNILSPGEKGILKVAFNGKMKNQYGFQSDNLVVFTDDEEEPAKSFSVFATLEDYFSPEETGPAPQLKLSTNRLEFGSIHQNQEVEKQLYLTNSGKKPLELRAIQSNCTCLKTKAVKFKLLPGETGVVILYFNPMERLGNQQKSVTLYSNDPIQPVQRVILSALVLE